jgi:hypothetical protein
MPAPTAQDQQFVIDLLRAGTSQPDVIAHLQARGFDAGTSQLLYQRGLSQMQGSAAAAMATYPTRGSGAGSGAAVANIVFGIVLILVGVGITIATYGAASGGGTYVIAFGPAIVGVVRIVRGMAQLANSR